MGGGGLISAFVVLTVAAIIATNLPDSTLRSNLMASGQPYLNALGVDQSWALFAPDPRRGLIDLRGVVTFDDGSSATWRFPRNGPLVGTYRDYRWRKWTENAISETNAATLWRSAALWAAKEQARPGRRAAKVRPVRRFAPLNPPGQRRSHRDWSEEAFYTLDISPTAASDRR
ncbi:MAG: hypothetical protein LC777_17255 [Actinobacteria bacterium]|nr:hypothetical protein [Actinomycetota bacterium]